MVSIPVKKLSHITHNKEAAAIAQKEHFRFTPQKKMGKAYKWDGSPIGESFQDDFLKPTDVNMPRLAPPHQQYRYISDSESLVPGGYYSWWGISPDDSCYDLRYGLRHPPTYLESPPPQNHNMVTRCFQETCASCFNATRPLNQVNQMYICFKEEHCVMLVRYAMSSLCALKSSEIQIL